MKYQILSFYNNHRGHRDLLVHQVQLANVDLKVTPVRPESMDLKDLRANKDLLG